MTLLNLDQLLAEMETEDYSNVPLNCTSGEEYEEWLREEIIPLKSFDINWHSDWHLEQIKSILKNDILSSVSKVKDEYKLTSAILNVQSPNWQTLKPCVDQCKILYKRGQTSFSIDIQKGCYDYGQAM